MHTYKRVVRLADTDATGVVYFASMQKIALEAFEDFLATHDMSLQDLVIDSGYRLPIVHVKADYTSPVFVGFELSVEMKLHKVGTSSISFFYQISLAKEDIPVGTVEVVHVCVSVKTLQAKAIPADLLEVFRGSDS